MSRILALLTTKGCRGIGHENATLHQYYNDFEWSQENLDALPEDDVPEDLHIKEYDEEINEDQLKEDDFIAWLTEGRHELEVARLLCNHWLQKAAAKGSDTFYDFFHILFREQHINYSDYDEVHTAHANNALSVTLLAKFVYEACALNFKVEGVNESDITQEIMMQIHIELETIRTYVSSWKNSGACAKPLPENMKNVLQQETANRVYAWPQILETPNPERDDARFVKAFPLTFPCGEADLRQPRIRDTFSVAEYVQHLFRYHTGHIVRSNRGQREVWALFNTVLREHAHKQRNLLHRQKPYTVLTKDDLTTLIKEENNLIHHVSAFGSDIPTTSMYWKRQSNHLEWIVRQMSWIPPWTTTSQSNEPETARRITKRSKQIAQKHASQETCHEQDDSYWCITPTSDSDENFWHGR